MSLENTKVGDVVYSQDYGAIRLWTIDRITANFCFYGKIKFNRAGRSTSGDVWHRLYAQPATPEIMNRGKHQKVMAEIRRVVESGRLKELDLKTLEAINELLAAGPAKAEQEGK